MKLLVLVAFLFVVYVASTARAADDKVKLFSLELLFELFVVVALCNKKSLF